MGYHQVGIPMNRAPKVRPEVSPWRAPRERGEAVGWHRIRPERRRCGTFCGPFIPFCGSSNLPSRILIDLGIHSSPPWIANRISTQMPTRGMYRISLVLVLRWGDQPTASLRYSGARHGLTSGCPFGAWFIGMPTSWYSMKIHRSKHTNSTA